MFANYIFLNTTFILKNTFSITQCCKTKQDRIAATERDILWFILKSRISCVDFESDYKVWTVPPHAGRLCKPKKNRVSCIHITLKAGVCFFSVCKRFLEIEVKVWFNSILEFSKFMVRNCKNDAFFEELSPQVFETPQNDIKMCLNTVFCTKNCISTISVTL